MRLPGPLPGTVVSLSWERPHRALIINKRGATRLGWKARLYAAGIGLPDQEVGEAQAPDRLLLRLMQAYGILRLAVELLLYRSGLIRPGPDEDRS